MLYLRLIDVLAMATNELIVEFNYDFNLYGIVSSLKEYQTAYHINKLLDIDLVKSKDFKVDYRKGGDAMFSMLTAETDSFFVRLIKNKAIDCENIRKPFFLAELQEYDYFLQIEGELHTYYGEDVLQVLKEMIHIQYVKQLVVENIDFKENLIY
jgi:hypothetical protein